MGWKPLNTNAYDIKTKKDHAIIGVYADFDIIQTPLGKQVIWNFVNEKGETFGIYGFTNLNLAMKKVFPGTKLRITYIGTKFMPTRFKKAGQDVHQARVEVDEESARNALAAGTRRAELPNLHESATEENQQQEEEYSPL